MKKSYVLLTVWVSPLVWKLVIGNYIFQLLSKKFNGEYLYSTFLKMCLVVIVFIPLIAN